MDSSITFCGFPIAADFPTQESLLEAEKAVPQYILDAIEAGEDYKEGQLVFTCKSVNERIQVIDPDYSQYGEGEVLSDISLLTDYNNCSYRYCGIEPAQSAEAIHKRVEHIRRECEEDSEFSKMIRGENYSEENCIIHDDGSVTFRLIPKNKWSYHEEQT